MRLMLITQGVSRLVKPLFDSEYDIIGIIESMPRDYDKEKKDIRSALFSFLKNMYNSMNRQKDNLRELCLKKNIPYNFLHKGKDEEVTAWVRELNPDLIVIFSMSQLIKEDLILIPKYGVINLHPSYLPEYRGPNPDFWQYYDMEMNPGVTVHYIDKGEDTGEVIFQERCFIPLGMKSPERLDKLIGEIGVSLVFKAIEAIKNGNAPRIKQPEKSPTMRARNLKLGEHKTIIDWENWPIERVWHLLCGTESWLSAIDVPCGLYRGQRWIIEDFEKCSHSYSVGKIVKNKKRYCLVVPEGYIYISLKFSLKRLVIYFLRR